MAKEKSDPVDVVTAFRDSIMVRAEPIFIGIDPGASGAIAFLCGSAYAVVDIPTVVVQTTRTKKNKPEQIALTGKKNRVVEGHTTRFNFPAICQIFDIFDALHDRIIVVLEDPPTSMGPGRHHAEVMLARAVGIWPLFICSKGLPLEEVKPMTWKRDMKLLKQDKEASRLKALALFPKADIIRKRDEGRAEALLLAEWARRR